MRVKRKVLAERSDQKMRRRYWLLRVKIWVVICILFYDAFIHGTPLYYMAFYFAGRLFGRLFSFTQNVEYHIGTKTFTLKSHPLHFLLIAVLLGTRFIWGQTALEHFDIVFVTDALALLFLGLNNSKLKDMINDLDRLVYGKIASLGSNGKKNQNIRQG